MNFRSRKFSEFSENLTRRTNERGRSKSESLYQVDEFPLREDVFARKSYDGYLLGNSRRNSTRRISLNLPRPHELRLPSIVSNISNRRMSLVAARSIDTQYPLVYNSSATDKRALFKTRSTQNFSSIAVKKVSGPMNRRGGKKIRRIMSLDNFFPLPFKNRILVCSK